LGLAHSESSSLPWGVDSNTKPIELSEQEKLLLKEPELKDSLKTVSERQLYDLNPQKLKQMWHAAMVRSLLKSKAKVLYSSLPTIEQIVYRQCENEKKIKLRCLVRLLDERDRVEAEMENLQQIKVYKPHAHSPSPAFSSFVSPSSPFYQLSPLLDLFTPKPGPSPPLEEPYHRPSISIKSFYSTNAVAELPHNLKGFRISSVFCDRIRYSPGNMKRKSVCILGGNTMATVQYSVYDDEKAPSVYKTEQFGRESQERLWMQVYPFPKKSRSKMRLYDQLRQRSMQHSPIRSQLRTLRMLRERRLRQKQWRLVEADHFRTKRSTYLTIDEAFEQFLRENRVGEDEDVSFLGTIPIDGREPAASSAIKPLKPLSLLTVNGARNSRDGADPLSNVITEALGTGSIQPVTFRPVNNVREFFFNMETYEKFRPTSSIPMKNQP
ncbi:hypothetical protein PENTCL1PPCAC_25873, partial [Pristionchus entomophagus]